MTTLADTALTPSTPALARTCAQTLRVWQVRAALLTVACLMALAALLPATVQAAALTAADEKHLREVIEAQLKAFSRDDAEKAYAYAAPNVRAAVGSASGFLAMVRRDYPVVYRPASVAFLKPEGQDDQAIQRVQMTDSEGNASLAVYSLARQKNKMWRITGCAVVENRGRMV